MMLLRRTVGSWQSAVGRNQRVLCCLLLTASCLLATTGCSPEWKRKFIRKGKEVKTDQPVLVLQADQQAMYPPEVRYQEHFAYWKSWHSDLLASLGEIRKRDLRTLDGVIGELRAMATVLSGPPSEHLRKILVELGDLRERWQNAPGSDSSPAQARSRLEQIQREIDKSLHYSKVKEWVGKPGTS